MYKIENTNYGVKATLNGNVEKTEAQKWFIEMKNALSKIKKDFKVFVDMRDFKATSQEVQRIFVDIQKEFKDHGMSKSVVILDNAIAVMQLKRTAKESGIYAHERYITPENNPNWEKQALDWILGNVDPDK